MALFVCLTTNAQRLTVHGQSSVVAQEVMPDSIKNQLIFDAGQYLDKAADFEAVTWGCALASGLSFGLIQDKDARNIVGCGFALAATVCKISAITYKKKSGAKLKIAAGYISLTF